MSEPTLPLTIRPEGDRNSVDDLKQWIFDHKEWLDEKLLEHGAILFRSFSIEEGIHFQEAVQCIEPELCDEYRGTSPRTLIPGTQFVFSASELPPRYPIPQHLEMSFLPSPPHRIFFCCLQPPTSTGGETPLCDFRKVYKDLDPKIRQEFEDKGVMYIRNYPKKKPLFSEPLLMKGWKDVFDTEDKSKVERELKTTNLNSTWKKNDDVCISSKAAAVEIHPQTGDKIWFNHLAVFHYSMMYEEFSHIYKRLGLLYYFVFSWIMWIVQMTFLFLKGPNSLALHTCFGDGTQIPQKYVSHVRNVLYKNMIFERWQKGDIIMIDNFRISHGRQPYTGKRKIVVAWSKPHLKPSFVKIDTN